MNAHVSILLAAASLTGMPVAAQQPARARPPVTIEAPRRDAKAPEPTAGRRDEVAAKPRDRGSDRRDPTFPKAGERKPDRRGSAGRSDRDDRDHGDAPQADARRFQLAHPFERGRFARGGPDRRYRVARVEVGSRRVWLPNGDGFQVAPWEWRLASGWDWRGDRFAILPDPDHLGWYLLFDLRLGQSVHVLFLGA